MFSSHSLFLLIPIAKSLKNSITFQTGSEEIKFIASLKIKLM